MIVREDFRDTEDLGGVFSGWDEEKKKYEPETWLYQGEEKKKSDPRDGAQAGHSDAGGGHGKDRGGEAAKFREYETDPTLQHPRCVFQILQASTSARYTPELIERHAGVPQKLFLKVAEAFCNASGPEKTAAICYAVGWTQHSKGVQIIRSAAILQMLLGNIGRPGGGILALRGHASIQGSTDIPTLYDILPGYLPMPFFEADANDLQAYMKKHTADAGLWTNFEKYFISLMKVVVRRQRDQRKRLGLRLPAARHRRSLALRLLARHGRRQDGRPVHHGAEPGRRRVECALAAHGDVEAEVAGGARHGRNRERLLVVQLARGRARRAATRRTSRPRSSSFPPPDRPRRKAARPTRSAWCSIAPQAVDPPGDARSETWFMHHLARRLKAKAAADPSPRNAAAERAALAVRHARHSRRAERQRSAERDQRPRSRDRRAARQLSRS